MLEKLFDELFDKYDKWTATGKVGRTVGKILSVIPYTAYYILSVAVGCAIGRFIYLTFLK